MVKDILSIDNARIVFRNFGGAADKYNKAGDRNFAVVIDDERYAQELANEGWNVKIKPPREEGDSPFCYLPVKMKFGAYPPNVYLQSGANMRRLDESTVGLLDSIDIRSASMDICPYNWKMDNGSRGVSAYLQNLKIVQNVDRFGEEYEQAVNSGASDEDTPF